MLETMNANMREGSPLAYEASSKGVLRMGSIVDIYTKGIQAEQVKGSMMLPGEVGVEI